MLRCSCGYSLVGSSSNGNGGKYYYYKCTANKYGKSKCQTKTLRKEALENFITTNIKNHIFTNENMLSMARYINGVSKENFERETAKQKELENKLSMIRQRIRNTQNLLADNKAKDQDLCFSMLKDFRKEGRELEAKLFRIKDLSYEPLEEKKILEYAKQAKGSFERSSLTENKRFIQSFVKEITINSDQDIYIEYTLPLGSGGSSTAQIIGDGASTVMSAPLRLQRFAPLVSGQFCYANYYLSRAF